MPKPLIATIQALKLLLKPLVWVAALFLVFEEWLWDYLKAQLHRLSNLPLVRRMEESLRALPAWASLLVLLVPAITLLPFKLAGLWALAHGHPVLGLGIFIAAKVTGTALAAYLFDMVRDKARELAWFNAVYLYITDLLRRAHAWLQRQPAYVATKARIAKAKQWWEELWP